ncbi:adenylate kinase 1 [Reticulomyxa filosa]|uniref:Adenylate kinase 1 n=1 Tax=Reticulomyxa filosa TaxID=46433 RepID=X6NE96_RETFI|nr:adenylate kinase 1 [Reticulomyxa filosa]|eukprot:ETO23672.1 adenylate kinase 1 [Reticulomyxa filosa]
MLKEKKKTLNDVVQLDVPDSILEERVTGRRVHKVSGRTYHTKFAPPKHEGKDDVSYIYFILFCFVLLNGLAETNKVTGEPLIQRQDDTSEVLKPRLVEYHKHATPVLEFYKHQGLVRKVDANDKFEVVWGRIRSGITVNNETPKNEEEEKNLLIKYQQYNLIFLLSKVGCKLLHQKQLTLLFCDQEILEISKTQKFLKFFFAIYLLIILYQKNEQFIVIDVFSLLKKIKKALLLGKRLVVQCELRAMLSSMKRHKKHHQIQLKEQRKKKAEEKRRNQTTMDEIEEKILCFLNSTIKKKRKSTKYGFCASNVHVWLSSLSLAFKITIL